ncbi:MAG: putative metal-binding motif-containing protein [Patescibacteria group bacterium]
MTRQKNVVNDGMRSAFLAPSLSDIQKAYYGTILPHLKAKWGFYTECIVLLLVVTFLGKISIPEMFNAMLPSDNVASGTIVFSIIDSDGDGFSITKDCDDKLKDIYPGAVEVCDGFDNDCDGQTDEADAENARTWYIDTDADKYGNQDTSVVACDKPIGFIESKDGFDCDDTNQLAWTTCSTCNDADNDQHFVGCNVYPNVVDCNDNDTDNWASCEVCTDADGDGYFVDCDRYTLREQDCDDTHAYVWDMCSTCKDADEDGFFMGCNTYLSIGESADCNDTDANVSPNADEQCDSIDNNCNGVTDEDTAVNATTWFADFDSDGFGGYKIQPVKSCMNPDRLRFVQNDADCDDANNTILDPFTCYADADGDGYGVDTDQIIGCACPQGYVKTPGDCNDANVFVSPFDNDNDGYSSCAIDALADCDDSNPSIYPSGTEICDGLDNDCDNAVDEEGAQDAPMWYLDADGDGLGGMISHSSCTRPEHYINNHDDCNDNDAQITGPTDWYPDADGDGDGSDEAKPQFACLQPLGYTDFPTDCDDNDPELNSSDADGDGFSTCNEDCDDDDPAISPKDEDKDGHSLCDEDCDDTNASTYTGATEMCNGVDDDCDGITDENDAQDAQTLFFDQDGDGFGNPKVSIRSCVEIAGYVLDNTDCNDMSSVAHLGATEVCDTIDNDCNGQTDEQDSNQTNPRYSDKDGDGYGDKADVVYACKELPNRVSNSDDCDDVIAQNNLADLDGDGNSTCDQSPDCDDDNPSLNFNDADGDGFYSCAPTTSHRVDCDDSKSEIFPGAEETCGDGIDQDCNGSDQSCPHTSAQAIIDTPADTSRTTVLADAGPDPAPLKDVAKSRPSVSMPTPRGYCSQESATFDREQKASVTRSVSESQETYRHNLGVVESFHASLKQRAEQFSTQPGVGELHRTSLVLKIPTAKIKTVLDEGTCSLTHSIESYSEIYGIDMSWDVLLALIELKISASISSSRIVDIVNTSIVKGTPFETFADAQNAQSVYSAISASLNDEADLKRLATWFTRNIEKVIAPKFKKQEVELVLTTVLSLNRSGLTQSTNPNNDMILAREFWLIKLANRLGLQDQVNVWATGFFDGMRYASAGLVLFNFYKTQAGLLLHQDAQ